MTSFILLCFLVLPRCCIFHKLQARPPSHKVKRSQLTLLPCLPYLRGREPTCSIAAVCLSCESSSDNVWLYSNRPMHYCQPTGDPPYPQFRFLWSQLPVVNLSSKPLSHRKLQKETVHKFSISGLSEWCDKISGSPG